MSTSQTPAELARQILSAASLPILDGELSEDSCGYRVIEQPDGTVQVSPVLDGHTTIDMWAPSFRTGAVAEWQAMNRTVRDVVTAQGWERTEAHWNGNVFRAPAGSLHPLVKETIHVLERDGNPPYARFDVHLLSARARTVLVDVAGGYNCRQLSLSDVASPALSAAGFDVETIHEADGSGRHDWNTAHHLVVRPPSERREEWALAHTVRRLLQANHRNVKWEVHMAPALPDHMPEGSAPDAHLGALMFQFSGNAVHDSGAFDYTLREAGYALAPSRHKWWRHMRILRPVAW
ncbi:hypothetical protein ACFYZ9_33645 [Streptomyces sp. NPDC001691]|uniref:hypothetical protein n=1 Tax=Streptomyces sp. NPDC001691 TaxID=3364600 RepID=UPI0036A6B58A